jgi:cytochrome c oxidase subunit 4
LALFVAIRLFAKGSPGTMNKEYQEATNEYLKVCFSFPYSEMGIGKKQGKAKQSGKIDR